jgi:antitoxin (DNA-binding transcriptional repressor) of toxin-antitoxin stability system
MKTVTFTEFRKNASRFVSAVEKGEIIVILRHGKPVAEMKPVAEETAVPAWKKPGLRLAVKGADLSTAIIEERERENIL